MIAGVLPAQLRALVVEDAGHGRVLGSSSAVNHEPLSRKHNSLVRGRHNNHKQRDCIYHPILKAAAPALGLPFLVFISCRSVSISYSYKTRDVLAVAFI